MISTSLPISPPSGVKQFLAMSSLFIASIGLLLFLKATYGTPDPKIHDEFSYLLAADTFAQGRLTNPSPDLKEHFESYHILLSPTYQSKYPPGQGLSLALGTVLFGEPIVGVFLTLALGIAVTVWAACAILPLRWALLPGFLLMLNPFVISRWGFSYWGGGVALLGGALVLGGLLRNRHEPTLSASIALVTGLAILSTSRPFEGSILGVILIGSLFAFWFYQAKQGSPPSNWLSRFLVPLAVGGALIFLGNGLYNLTVTGDALLFPHAAWNEANFDKSYKGSRNLGFGGKLLRLEQFYLAPIVWAPVIGLGVIGALLKNRPAFLWLTGLLAIPILALVSVRNTAAWPHYLAPLAPLLYILLSAGFHSISEVRLEGKRVGLLCVLLVFSAQLMFVTRTMFSPTERSQFSIHMWFVSPGQKYFGLNRGDLERYLQNRFPEERHLVLMRYLPGHRTHIEWVYNRANLMESDIIFARSLGAGLDNRLLAEFPDRHHWTVEMKDYDLRICHERKGEPHCLTGKDLLP